jgi:hypothetical protein
MKMRQQNGECQLSRVDPKTMDSYVTGIMNAVGASIPKPVGSFPGWDKPVPAASF